MENRSATRFLVCSAGILGALSVLVGAFAAHGLEDWLLGRGIDAGTASRRLGQLEVGVRYQFFHALALLGLVAAEGLVGSTWTRWIGWMMIVGVFFFSGSLYLLVSLNLPVMGAITPIGGVTWVVAWGLLAIQARRQTRLDEPKK